MYKEICLFRDYIITDPLLMKEIVFSEQTLLFQVVFITYDPQITKYEYYTLVK